MGGLPDALRRTPARAMWKAELSAGEVRLPVKLYAAVRDTTPRFRLLHGADLAPVQQQMVDPLDGRPVPKEEIRRGLQVAEGTFVVLTEDERQALEPAPSRVIRIAQLVPPDRIDPRWFGRPYYLGPDGDDEGYFALAEALERRGRVGIARWVMRKKHYHGAVDVRDGYLVLETLRNAEELVQLERIDPPRERVPDPRELALAEQLVATLADRFDPAAYRDEYHGEVVALIEAKAHGGELSRAPPEARAPEPQRSLAATLEASLHGGGAQHGG